MSSCRFPHVLVRHRPAPRRARRQATVSAAQEAGRRTRLPRAAATRCGPPREAPSAGPRPTRRWPPRERGPRLRHPRSGGLEPSCGESSVRAGRLHLPSDKAALVTGSGRRASSACRDVCSRGDGGARRPREHHRRLGDACCRRACLTAADADIGLEYRPRAPHVRGIKGDLNQPLRTFIYHL